MRMAMKMTMGMAAGAVVIASLTLSAQPKAPALTEATADKFARLALACVAKEYPNKIAHVLNCDLPSHALTAGFVLFTLETRSLRGEPWRKSSPFKKPFENKWISPMWERVSKVDRT
jgi:hypothetical protein